MPFKNCLMNIYTKNINSRIFKRLEFRLLPINRQKAHRTSYVLTDDGKYILINYGSVSSQPAKKIRDDILACFDKAKLSLPKDKIEKIICGHCSTNISIEQFGSIKESIEGVAVELIGIDTLSHDLALIYPHIAKDELGIQIDTNQFFDVEDLLKHMMLMASMRHLIVNSFIESLKSVRLITVLMITRLLY